MPKAIPTRVYQRSNRVHELSSEERAVYDTLAPERIPQHVAIIMDGNGRWAGKRALKRFLGHQQGAESVQYVVETASRIDLPWLTLYAFSLENNLRRPKSEVSFLMKLLKSYLVSNLKRMQDNNIRMAYIGRTHELPAEVQDTMRWAEEQTSKNTGTTLTLALNYGSRTEIVDSARSIVRGMIAEATARGISLEDMLAAEGMEDAINARFSEQQMSSHLYTGQMPDPDLVVRTSGEQRISNFLLWQIAYAEIFVTDRLWPDFRGLHLLEAIAAYQQRERRFGGLGESSDENLSDILPGEAELARRYDPVRFRAIEHFQNEPATIHLHYPMEMLLSELKNKRVLVVGLGKSGLAAARFLKQHGAQVTVSDARPATVIAELPTLLEQGIMVETGSHGLLTFRRQDLIVVSPGVPLSVPELQQVRALGMPVIGELELGTQSLKGETIAITGSNGKTTTTSLLGEILKMSGRPTLVGGNIGRPVTEMVADSTAESWSVLEVSSFQLETTQTFRPRIAVVLNITPDHLDRHGSFAAYAAAKDRITEYQTLEDFLVLNAEDERTKLVAAKTKAQIFWFSPRRQVKQGSFVHGESIFFRAKEGGQPEPVLPVAEITLAGAHNVENVLAAVCAARLAGVPADTVRRGVAGFKAVEHRLEFVRELQGVRYYNDSKATNVDATAKAIEAFAGGLQLILGGKDKDSNYATLAPLLRERIKTVITIGSAAEKIEQQLAGLVKIERAETLDRAVALARREATPGDIVLLAPACSSFDQFENYEHRGRTFKQLVTALQ